jgi:hypothetical protein
VATDTDGNVVVTGFSYNGDSNDDYLTIKYSAAGVRLWTNIYNGTGNWVDHANAIAVDSNGNVFVTGESWNGIRYDYLTIVYSSSGVPLWTRRYNDEQGNAGSGNAIKVDATGNVIVTGDGCVTIKYSGAGVALWTNRVGLASGLALAVDGSGNVFVTGTVSDPPFGVDYLTVAYSATGMPLWTNIYDGPANGDDRPAAVAVDSSGNVFVTGYSYGVGTSEDWATIKYSIPPLQPIPLNYQAIGSQLVLSWTNAAFSLQTAPAAQGTYTNIHGATSPWTNGFSNAQGYFRLKAN